MDPEGKNSHKRKPTEVDEEKENQGNVDIIKKKLRPSMDWKEKSECGSFVESVGGCSSSVKTTLPLQKPLKITIRLFDKLKGCETNGRERIVDMVKRKLKETYICRKANTDFLFFKRMSDEAYLNIGTPTGVLQEEEIYECIFKNQMRKKTTDMMRSYNAEKFDKTWGIKSFYVKLTDVTFSVSYLQKFKAIGKLLIHFFPGETLYEALYRDGRFQEHTKDGLVIRICDIMTPNDVEICLNVQASNHAHEVLKFKRRKTINYDLASEVSPQPEPPGHLMAVKMEPPLKANRGNTEYPSLPTQDPPSSAPASKVPKNLHTLEGLAVYLKDKLGLEIIKQSDEYKEKTKQQVDKVKETKRNNDRVFKKHYENFALHFNHRVFLSDLEETIQLMKPSIGAIIANNISNVSVCGATCFRIGIKYVITNRHVVDEIKNLGIDWRNCYVDFNYKEEGQPGHCVSFTPNHPVLVSSVELDYAILKLNPEGRNLPPSVIDPDFGFNIAPPDRQLRGEDCLSFIGHPGGLRKQMDVSCSIKQKGEIEDHLALAFKTLDEQEFQEHRVKILTAENNPNSAVYDVSTFFKGSSGSPGFLMKEKLLIVLHSRGIPYKGNRNFFAVEEGMLMASVVKDVMSKINVQHHDVVQRRSILGNIFGESTAKNFYPEEMDIDSE